MTYPGDNDPTRPVDPPVDATRTMGADGQPAAGGPANGSSPPPGPDDENGGKRWWWIAAAALMVGLLVGGGIALATGGDDDEPGTTTTSSSTAPSTSPSTAPPPTAAPTTAAPTPPAAVSGLTAAAGGGSGEVSLEWDAVPTAVSYRIYRSATSGVDGSLIATVNTTEFTDAPGVTAYYQVSAVGSNGLEGGRSSQICGAPAGDSC